MSVARKSERALDYSFDVLVSNKATSMSLAVFLDFLVLAFIVAPRVLCPLTP